MYMFMRLNRRKGRPVKMLYKEIKKIKDIAK